MVTITPIEVKNNDERGYLAEYFHGRTGDHLIIFTRKGVVRGRHYHKGASATKDPEIFMLIAGKCRLSWKHAGSGETTASAVAEAPAKVEIPAGIWHEMVAITDCTILEMNSLSEHAADTYYDG
jgi:dTDP-4-dehydrorhamnose 3,5-epimerase-like enzyme